VVLRFEPDAADDAVGWLFHPTQKVEREADGALIVRFHAGGQQEMCWHLFTWGTAVKVISPAELRAAMAGMAKDGLCIIRPQVGRLHYPWFHVRPEVE